MGPTTRFEARTAKAEAKKRLKGVVEINGIGITNVRGGYAITINLSTPVALSVKLPKQMGRVPIRFEVVGLTRPFS